ncbi:MAG: hypothetical protein ACOYL3_28690 [Desulfuromonadaceae bacterium]
MDKKEELKLILRKQQLYCKDAGGFIDAYTKYSFYSAYLDIFRSIDEQVHFYGAGYICDSDKNLLCKWDIENNNLDSQSDETIDFVYELIVNHKVVHIIIKDSKILKEYDLLLQKVDKSIKLVEQNICPECSANLEIGHDDDKTCLVCGWW